MPVAHSFAALGVGHRPAALRIARPPQAVALPLQGSVQPIEVLYDGQCMVSGARTLPCLTFRASQAHD